MFGNGTRDEGQENSILYFFLKYQCTKLKLFSFYSDLLTAFFISLWVLWPLKIMRMF